MNQKQLPADVAQARESGELEKVSGGYTFEVEPGYVRESKQNTGK